MPRTAIQHGTRAGYKKGCRNRVTCPGNEKGVKCSDAANQYNRDLRALRAQSAQRQPVNTGTRPGTSGLRVRIVNTRSEPPSTQDHTEAYPQPDMPLYDPPDSLVNAQVPDDPEPAEAGQDVYNQPEFIITPKIRDTVAGNLGLYAVVIGMPLEAIDPYCGKAFADNCDNIISKMLPLILRSPAAVKFFTSASGGWLDWVALIQACWPVVQAIYAHHLARTVSKDKRPMPNATMPPGPDPYEYSAA